VLTEADAVCCLVHDIHLHQHVLEGHSHRAAAARDPHNRAIRLRLRMVSSARSCGTKVSAHEANNALSQVRDKAAVEGVDHGHTTFDLLPDWRTHPERRRDVKNTRISRTYHQRAVSAAHGRSVQHLPRHSVFAPNIPFPNTLDIRRHPRLLSAFASAILFVVQNIVSKQIFNDAAAAEKDGLPPTRFTKPDKLNLLCYSSGLAFLFTLPLWLWSEGFTLLGDFLRDASIELSDHPGAFDHGRLLLEFLFNGTFHFGQNIVAFVLLSMVSPVTYSVASLIKRVFVIVFAVVWFGKPITKIQAFGLLLTFVGLYLYDRTSDSSKADKRAKAMHSKSQGTLLPLATDLKSRAGFTASPASMSAGTGAYPIASIAEARDDDGAHRRNDVGHGYLPPGTKAEETWRPHGMNGRPGIGVS
jgi:hypothetical protein